MKHLLIAAIMAVAAVGGIAGYQQAQHSNQQELSAFMIANIETLTDGESGTQNTGPAEEKKCFGGGHRMVCRCINSNPCTGTDCY